MVFRVRAVGLITAFREKLFRREGVYHAGEDDRYLGPADGGAVVGIGRGDLVGRGIVHIGLIPGRGGGEGVTRALIGGMEAAGDGHGLADGEVAAHIEDRGAGALHQAVLIGGLDRTGVPGAGLHVGELTGGIGLAAGKIGQAGGGFSLRRGQGWRARGDEQ